MHCSDHFVDLVTLYDDPARQGALLNKLLENYKKSPMSAFKDPGMWVIPKDDGAGEYRATFIQQLTVLVWRNSMNFKRDVGGFVMNFTQMVLAALLIGAMYWQLGYSQEAAQSRAGFVSFCVIGYIMTQIINMAHRFPKQKLVFLRDRQSRLYGVPAFYIALVITEIIPTTIIPIVNTCISYWMADVNDDLTRFLQFTIFSVILFHVGISAGMMLSAICPTVDVTLGVSPLVGIVWVLVGGFWINYQDIPDYLKWLSFISPVKYGTQAWMSIMFWGTTFTCDPQTEMCFYQTGEDVLVAYGMEGADLDTCAIMLGVLWVAIHLLGAFFLQITDLLNDKKWMSQFTKQINGWKVSATTTTTNHGW